MRSLLTASAEILNDLPFPYAQPAVILFLLLLADRKFVSRYGS